MWPAIVSFQVLALIFGLPVAAQAQTANKLARIGYIRAEAPPPADLQAFRQGLREHGYVEGKNIVVEYRWADGNEQRLPAIVEELLGLKVDLIVASAPAATRAAKDATRTVPIVMVLVADPEAFGFVATLARPGGNITGFAFLLPELSGKRLQILKQAMPRLSRVAVLWHAANPYKEFDLKEVRAVAEKLSVAVQPLPVRGPDDFVGAFQAAAKSGANGLITLDDPFTITHRAKIAELARQHGLPAVYGVRPFMDVGGLMFYGPNRSEQNRRVAFYIDKILKGAKPAELPVERPTRYELAINLNAARAIGFTVPPSLLLRADQVVD